MSLTSALNRVSYVATAGQTVFAYPFKIYASTDLQVYANGTLIGSGYTVSGVGGDTGGNVTFSVGRTAGDLIVILRVEPLTQTTVLPTNGPFPSKSVETMSDKLTMISQQLQETDNRTLRLEATTLFPNLAPLPDPSANSYLRWNGTAFTWVSASGTVLSVPAQSVYFGTTAPSSPLTGQTYWFDQTANRLKGWTGTRWLTLPIGEPYYVTDFGAKGDGVTDDVVAIQAAIDAAPQGQSVEFSAATYAVSGQLNISKPLRLFGRHQMTEESGGSLITTLAAFPSTSDLFSVTGPGGVTFENLKIHMDSRGRDAIRVTGDKHEINIYANSFFNGAVGSKYINFIGDGSLSVGIWASRIENNRFRQTAGDGIYVTGGGDNVVITRNTWTLGPNGGYALYWDQLLGSWGPIVAYNNFGDPGAKAIHIVKADQAKFIFNEVEQISTSTNPGAAMLFLEGAVGATMQSAQVIGNNFNGHSNVTNGVKLDRVTNALIGAGNRFQLVTKDIATTANTAKLAVGSNWPSGSAIFNEAGAAYNLDPQNGRYHFGPMTGLAVPMVIGNTPDGNYGSLAISPPSGTIAYVTFTETNFADHGAIGFDAGSDVLNFFTGGNVTGGTKRMRVGPGVQIGAPTGGDKGAGTINIATGYFVNGADQYRVNNVAYSASMTPDISLGRTQRVTATNATAFTINNPINSQAGDIITIMIRNASGGALGALTFGAGYKIGAAWTQPANGFSRSIQFLNDGTNWVEVGRTAADVAN